MTLHPEQDDVAETIQTCIRDVESVRISVGTLTRLMLLVLFLSLKANAGSAPRFHHDAYFQILTYSVLFLFLDFVLRPVF
jgi:hypothetical protein